jgi:hypothetical protein
MGEESVYPKPDVLVLEKHWLVASQNPEKLQNLLVLKRDQLVPQPKKQKPLVLVPASPTNTSKVKLQRNANQDGPSGATVEHRISAVPSTAEASVSGYDLSGAQTCPPNTFVGVPEKEYIQVISSLRKAMAGGLSDDTSKTVKSRISGEISENTVPTSKD